MKKIIIVIVFMILSLFILAGCTEVDSVKYDISRNADNFDIMRKISIYNSRTNEFLIEITGNFSLQNNTNKELEIICKTGDDKYKKNYIYLNDDIGYFVEDLTGDKDFGKYYYEIKYFSNLP